MVDAPTREDAAQAQAALESLPSRPPNIRIETSEQKAKVAQSQIEPSTAVLLKAGIAVQQGPDGRLHFTDNQGGPPAIIDPLSKIGDSGMHEGASQEAASNALSVIADGAKKNPEIAKAAVRDLSFGVEAYAEDLLSKGDLVPATDGQLPFQKAKLTGEPYDPNPKRNNAYVVNIINGRDVKNAIRLSGSASSITASAGAKPSIDFPEIRMPTAGEAADQLHRYIESSVVKAGIFSGASGARMAKSINGAVNRYLGHVMATVDPDTGTMDAKESQSTITALSSDLSSIYLDKSVAAKIRPFIHPSMLPLFDSEVSRQGPQKAPPKTPEEMKADRMPKF